MDGCYCLITDLVSRSRPGSRLSASASRNNSRNASPEVRRFGCRDAADADGHSLSSSRGPFQSCRVRVHGDDMRDYAELVDEEGDYSTPSGKRFPN